MKRLTLTLLLLVLGVSSVLAQSETSEPVERPRQADLADLLRWIGMEQSFTDQARAEAIADVEGHRKGARTFSDAAFYMEVRRIVALADNGHSNVTGRPIHDTFGVLPLRLYWFSDGLHIVRARGTQRALLGARLDAVDGVTLAEIEEKLKRYHGGTSAFFRRYTAPSLILCPALLHAVGLANSPDQLELRVTAETGESKTVTVAVDPSSSGVVSSPWRMLNPASIAGERDWFTVRGSESDLPLYLQDEDKLFRYESLREGEFVYIQLRANIGPAGNPIEKFTKATLRRLKEDLPLSIILDNRQNGGGDLSKTAAFGLALPGLTFPEGRVFVLTDPATFSAGIYTSLYPKAADPERTVLIGEPVGDRGRFWAETGPGFSLGKSGYGIGYALQLHDVIDGCQDPEVCHMMRYDPRWNLAVGTLDPNWPVETRYADFKAGSDPLLEGILRGDFDGE